MIADNLSKWFKEWLDEKMYMRDKYESMSLHDLETFFDYCKRREELERVTASIRSLPNGTEGQVRMNERTE